MGKIFVVKIGERVFPYIRKISSFLKSSKFSACLLLFPGGWEVADLIRAYRKKWHLNDITCYYMALSILDMNAYLLKEIWPCGVVSSIKEIKKYFQKEKVCTFLPSKILRRKKLEQIYDVNIDKFSSDSSACVIAHLIKADVIFLKDVDGIFSSDPKRYTDSKLVAYIKAEDLIGNFTCLDSTVGYLLKNYKINAWVINGKYPQRILKAIKGLNAIGTYISCE
jgi:hypothetical protein